MRLIVCRTAEGWRHVVSASTRATEQICVASDDPIVRSRASSIPNIKAVAYTEQMESLYSVSDDVKAIIKTLNSWMVTYGKIRGGCQAEILYWPEHVEGGMTTQRIQDALLLIRSYLKMLDTTDATEVSLIWSRNSSWEDRVLSAVCRSRGITLRQLGTQRTQQLIDTIKYIVKNLLLREPLNIARAFFTKVVDGRKGIPSDREILFQLGSSLPRHVDNVLPIMTELKKIGYCPVALSWSAHAATKKIKLKGIDARNLESYLSFKEILEAYFRMWRTWISVKTSKEKFVTKIAPSYQSVPLGELLWPSIRHFIHCELAQAYRFQRAMRTYMESHSPLAVKLWGGDALFEGQALIRCLKVANRPLLMFWFRGFTPDPYEKDEGNIDLYLASGKIQREYLLSLNVNDYRIRIVGMSHYDMIPNFIKNNTAVDSRRKLGITKQYVLHVLFDLSIPYRGLLSPREFLTVMDFMGEFSIKNPSIALIVKPHPSTPTEIIRYFLKKYSASNIYNVENVELPYHAINASDLLVCKCTTLGLEAALIGKPIISIGLDKEYRFRIFGNAAEYVETIEELERLLKVLTHVHDRRAGWLRERSQQGKRFVDEYINVNLEASAMQAAKIIHEHLSNKTQSAILAENR